MAQRLDGSGLRLLECLRLRVKDLDFTRRQLTVRDGTGAQDRVTMLPLALVAPLQAHLVRRAQAHARELAHGTGAIALPSALERTYPNGNRAWVWQFVFPARRDSLDPATGAPRRHHRHERSLQRAVHPRGRDCQTRGLPHLPPELCDPSAVRPQFRAVMLAKLTDYGIVQRMSALAEKACRDDTR